MRFVWVSFLVLLTGCGDVVVGPAPTPAGPSRQPELVVQQRPARGSARNFVQVVDDVMPVAVRECRTRTSGVRCDYLIVVDDTPGAPPNAFQTIGRDGQPVVGFTVALLGEARNRDELAFILGHEAAHHIRGHIGRGRASALTGAQLAGALVTLGGGAVIMGLLGWRLPNRILLYVAYVVAIAMCLTALTGFSYFFVGNAEVSGALYRSDTGILADIWGGPHWLWGGVMVVLSVVILIAAVFLSDRWARGKSART